MSFGEWLSNDGKLILIEKTVRTIPYGFLGVAFSVYLSQLGFDGSQIGVVLTLTILSSALYTFAISFVADRIGRGRTLVFFALTDFVAGELTILFNILVGPSPSWDRRQHDRWLGRSWTIPLDRASDASTDI